ncbi:MAG: recombinase family protein [Clostridia bacterium]|nr:recombinase family protein [Clostridia bacterium]
MVGNNSFKVGIYIRLSRDDGNIESDSIVSQRSLLNQYIKENNYNLIDEYVDDGFTGTNFERPSFKRMIKDIELGRINMIITKDMSRLGRDYIGTGELIEKYFPNNNVRYIAINDGIDTFIDNTSNDIAPFKAIMNDMYAKDISKKVKSSLHTRMKDGLYVSGRCPFGYMKDPNNKNHLVINEKQAETVRLIFDLALKGNTYHSIAQYLTDKKIKTPASYYNYVWNTKSIKGNTLSQEKGIWFDTTIRSILINQIYVGDTVQGKTKKINYKLKKTVKNNPKDYIIVENTHDAIIDRDTFNYVQTILPKNVKRPEKKRFYLLDGLLYCGDCKHRIIIRYQNKTRRSYTTCDYYRTYSKYHVCTTHTNNYEILEKVILEQIEEVCKKYLDKNKIKDSLGNITFEDNILKITKQIESLELTNNKLTQNLDKTYMDMLKGIIDEEQYLRISENLKQEIENNKLDIDNFQNEKINENTIDNKKIEKYIDEFLSLEKPTRELIINLVEKIYIYQDKKVDIIFTFKNVT